MKSALSKTAVDQHLQRVYKHDHIFKEIQAHHAGRTPGFDSESMAIWFGMVQTFLALESRVSLRAQTHGLTLPGMNVLGVLCRHEPEGIALNELSHYLTVSRANVTGLIDNLVRKGLVKRVDHPTDRRSCLARITPKGKAWLDAFLPGHFKAIKEILAPLSKIEKATFLKLLTRVRQRLLESVGKL